LIIGICCGCICCKRSRKFINPTSKLAYHNKHQSSQIDSQLKEQDEWEIDRKLLVVGSEKLGSGAFGNVYKGTLIDGSPKLSVVKNLKLEIVDNYVAIKVLPSHSDANCKTDFSNEIEFMKRLGYHPHIVCLLGCVSDPEEPMLIVEYCAHGDMLKFLKRNRSSLLQVCSM
jgi:hypothetical protein